MKQTFHSFHFPGFRGRANSNAGSTGNRSRSSSGSSHTPLAIQEQDFNKKAKNLEVIIALKQDHFNNLAQKIDQSKITNLVDLDKIIEQKLNEGTTYEDMLSYYKTPKAQRSKNLTPPVFADQRLEKILLDEELDKKAKIKNLKTYYILKFSTMSVTEIMRAGYAMKTRNDFATAITQALPNDSSDRRAYDQFYQNTNSFNNVQEQMQKEKEAEILDETALQRHNDSLDSLDRMMIFLGTPEQESACRVSLALMSIENCVEPLGSADQSSFGAWLYKQREYLATNTSTFKEQRDILNELQNKFSGTVLDEGKSTYVNTIINELNHKGRIPVDAQNLKALYVMSRVRAFLLNYLKEKNAVNERNAKLIFLESVIAHLDRLVDELRNGVRTGVSVLSVEGNKVDNLNDVTNVHQLIFLMKKKFPISALSNSLSETIEGAIKTDLNAVEDWNIVKTPTSSSPDTNVQRKPLSTTTPNRNQGPTLHVKDFSLKKIDATLHMIMAALSIPTENVSTQIARIKNNIPQDLYRNLLLKHDSNKDEVPIHEFFDEIIENTTDQGEALETMELFHQRALFHDFASLAKRAWEASNHNLAFEVLETMLPFAQYEPTMRSGFMTLLDELTPDYELPEEDDDRSRVDNERIDDLEKQLEKRMYYSNSPIPLVTSDQYRALLKKFDHSKAPSSNASHRKTSSKSRALAKQIINNMSACLSEYIQTNSEKNLDRDFIDPPEHHENEEKIHMIHFKSNVKTLEDNTKTIEYAKKLLSSLQAQYSFIKKIKNEDPELVLTVLDTVKQLSSQDTGSKSLNKKLKKAVRQAEEFGAEQENPLDLSGSKYIDPI